MIPEVVFAGSNKNAYLYDMYCNRNSPAVQEKDHVRSGVIYEGFKKLNRHFYVLARAVFQRSSEVGAPNPAVE